MSLYKYVPPERLDVLGNLRIRFTQPNAQNDPFEFRPLVKRFRRPEVARQALSVEYDRQFDDALLGRFGQADADCIRKTWPALLTSLKLRGMAKADRQSDPAARREIAQLLNSRIGILSLSEIPDSFLMWCRYALERTGFVYELDDKHPWFWAKTDAKDDTHELRKVSYVDVPALPYLAELEAQEVLYNKRKKWECEREWRIIRPFVESSERIGEDIYLFDVPPSVLTGVIVGGCATDDSMQGLVQIIASNADLAHLRVGCAHLIPTEHRVEIEWCPASVAQIKRDLGRFLKRIVADRVGRYVGRRYYSTNS
jgi:hypothetical protein